MFHTIRKDDEGLLFHIFMHENGHIIDQNPNGCGFELWNGLTNNPYDKTRRKYEIFNETLNDIFAMEATQFLKDHGIYLMEPKEFTTLDASNHNTALITKNLLQPLIQKFRQQVIKAKINAAPQELVQYIGEENFEELVDAVNKVDYLTRNGLIRKMRTSKEDPMVLEYFEQLERVKQIYSNIDKYYANHFKGFNI